jgi:hypothetical protein
MPAVVEEEKPGKKKPSRAAIVGPRAYPDSEARLSSGMSMSTLRYTLRNLFQRKSIGRYGHIQDLQGIPFYEARQPWWARFTWGIIAADLLVT